MTSLSKKPTGVDTSFQPGLVESLIYIIGFGALVVVCLLVWADGAVL